MRGIRMAGWVVASLLAICGSAAGDSDAANAALKQITKATKGLRGIVAEVEYSEIVGKRSINGSGKLYVHYAGILRVEVGGDQPRTVLFSPPFLYTHRHANQVVEISDVRSNPHLLGQYILLGFATTGKDLKQHFDVRLVENSTLNGKPVLNFLLTPKPKKSKEAAGAIARIQLWVDPQNGLPVQHEIVHAAGEVQLRIRYLSVSRDDELSNSLFRPDWPDGVTTVRN